MFCSYSIQVIHYSFYRVQCFRRVLPLDLIDSIVVNVRFHKFNSYLHLVLHVRWLFIYAPSLLSVSSCDCTVVRIVSHEFKNVPYRISRVRWHNITTEYIFLFFFFNMFVPSVSIFIWIDSSPEPHCHGVLCEMKNYTSQAEKKILNHFSFESRRIFRRRHRYTNLIYAYPGDKRRRDGVDINVTCLLFKIHHIVDKYNRRRARDENRSR